MIPRYKVGDHVRISRSFHIHITSIRDGFYMFKWEDGVKGMLPCEDIDEKNYRKLTKLELALK